MEHESSSSSVKDRDRVRGSDSEKDRIRSDKKHDEHKANSASPKRPRSRDVVEREKNWNYPPGLDNIMATGAFWQNYSGKQQINSTHSNNIFSLSPRYRLKTRSETKGI